MSAMPHPARDALTMLRRDLLHARRFPMLSLSSIGMPTIFLLLFGGVFGNTMRAGLGSAIPAGGTYIDYLTPGILLLTAAAAAETTAVAVSTDMTEGIITRFRTMAISRMSVLTGTVLGSFLRTMLSGALVLAVAVALGFRPSASALDWIGVVAMFGALTLALTWLTVAFGLFARTPAGANSLSLLLVVVPFVSSAYVPTDSMPTGVRWFAENQPFTPIIQTLRGLLTGTAVGHQAILGVAWCLVIATVGYLWARARYDRNPAPVLQG